MALLNARDAFHDWARETFATVAPPLLTCEAVLAEACYLLRNTHRGAGAVMELVTRKVLAIPFDLATEALEIERLLGRYRDVPISLADACLVRMAELHPNASVMTLDGDFLVYRKSGRRVIATIMPEGV